MKSYEQLRTDLKVASRMARGVRGVNRDAAVKFKMSISKLYQIRESDMLKTETQDNRKLLRQLIKYYNDRKEKEDQLIQNVA